MYFMHTVKLRNRPLPRVVHMEGSMPSRSTMLVPKNTARKAAASPAEGRNTFQENFFRGSLGRNFISRKIATTTSRVINCRWDRR